ncbi:hypothetical protein BC941DRAFT_132694 [Chlamydoabsidia padenii]|nr:hypothetical protein BC941DRAFT_132694 [Chlamydoabsidia padenii]
MANSTYSTPSSPVVCIPKNQTDSNEQDKQHQTTRNDFDDFLVSKTLYMGDLPVSVRETDIKTLLQHCMPVEMHIRREGDDQDEEDSYLRFNSKQYADRAYTLYHGFKFTNGATLQLRMYLDPTLELEAFGDILEITNLAPDTDDVHRLYDQFRPFGPLQLCISNGQGTAMIQYFNSADSIKAINKMNGKIWGGNKITITPQPLDKDNTAISGIPSSSVSLIAQQDSHSGEQESTQQQQSSQQEQPTSLQQDQQQQAPTSTVKPHVDYLNLYIKNMDPLITNEYLYEIFGKFGKIVSARVISNPVTKQSRGYGFVSFSRDDEAANALREMDRQMVFSKPLYVSYHVPKKGRNENSNNGNSNNGNNSNGNSGNITNNNNTATYNTNDNNRNHFSPAKEQSSYSTMQQNTNMTGYQSSYQQEQYVTTPIVNLPRKQDPIVHQVHPSTAMIEEMNPYKNNATIKLPRRKSSVVDIPHQRSPLVFPAAPVVSSLDGQRTPILSHQHNSREPRSNTTIPTFTPSLQTPTPDRRRISMESMMTDTTASIQRQKMINAVIQCGCCSKERTGDIVDLLMTLNRKERSLCLFNTDFLKEKVMLALDSLDTFDDDEEEKDGDDDIISTIAGVGNGHLTGQHSFETMNSMSPVPLRSNPINTPDYQSNGRKATTNKIKNSSNNHHHLPVTPPLSSLSTSDLTSGRVSPANIDDFLASISSMSIHTQKQKLGDIMWNYVKPLAKPLAKVKED